MYKLHKVVSKLEITLNEDLAGENTKDLTVNEIDYYIKTLSTLWEQYKKDNKLS